MASTGSRRGGVNNEAFHDLLRGSLRNSAKILMSMTPPRSPAAGHLSPTASSFASSPSRTTASAFASSTRTTPSNAKARAAAVAAAEAVARELAAVTQRQAALEVPATLEDAHAQGWHPAQRAVHFQDALLRKYGSMVSAWKVLDPLEHGRLSFLDFCRTIKQIGYIVDAQALWQSLDTNKDGFLTLEEIDPELAHVLFEFSTFLTKTCKSAERAWRKYFGESRVGRCSRERFIKKARGLGYQGDIDAVFDALDVEHTIQGISFKDFRLLDKWFKGVHKKPSHKPKILPPHKEFSWNFEVLRSTNSAPDLRAVGAARLENPLARAVQSPF